MRKLKIGELALVAAMTLTVSDAQAFWHSHGSYGSGSSGSYGSYASHGSSSSYGSYASSGSSGSYGSHGGGLIARKIARHASRGSHGSYASHGSSSSYGSYASVTVSYSSHASSGSSGSYSSYGSSSHGSYSSVSQSSAGSYGTVISGSSTVSQPTYASSTGSGTLSVSVPADAVVFVNGAATKSTGTQRQYVSNGLAQGEDYAYEVRVEYELNGEKVVESKSATLTANGTATLSFTAGEPTPVSVAEAETTVTKLIVRVPEGAAITLAGAPTKQTGEQREFTTTRLASGQTWEDYQVKVEVAGVVQQRTITLRGGDSQELVFNFSSDQVAAK